ncbi:MAG TPA: hypothetical protein VN516_00085 [Candidatus Baltobacteraceae bacterium]|nr:hypothetical protein [Candidatus Baltobacteraceae bacterium]
MTSSSNNPNPNPALAGDSTAAAGVSKINAPESSTGAKFFIRADGQYFIAQKWHYKGLLTWAARGIEIKFEVMQIRTAVLGFTPSGKGQIFLMEEFFFN